MDVDRQGRGGDHLHEGQQPVKRVVGVEAVGVVGRADPGPPNGDEKDDETPEARQGDVAAQLVGELGHRHHEDEVEKEFQPGGVPRLTLVPHS